MKNTDYNINNVVLADDDEDHAYLFKLVLREVSPNKSITIVKNGEDLMKHLEKEVPDLLFLDLDMPVKHGFQCLQEIREIYNYDFPIVVYSSSTYMSDIQKSYVHKADLYMVKPFNAEHLRSALNSIFNLEWIDKVSPKHYFMNNRYVPFTG